MLQWKIRWKHDTGNIHVELNKTLEGRLRLKYKTGRALFTSKLTVQFACLSNLPMVLCHYQHKQSCGTLRRCVR